MKFQSLFTLSAALTLFPALPVLRAENAVVAMDAKAPRYAFYGWLQSGVTVNSHAPDDRQNFGALFTDRANEPLLNQLVYTAERGLEPAPGQADWGFKLQGMLGSDARFIHAIGLLDNVSNKLYQPDLVEAFLQFHLPVLTEGGLDLKAGKFVTLEGAETIDPRTNLFYSHAYIFNFGIPFHHTGVLAVLHGHETGPLFPTRQIRNQGLGTLIPEPIFADSESGKILLFLPISAD